jgi:hypothetical protein
MEGNGDLMAPAESHHGTGRAVVVGQPWSLGWREIESAARVEASEIRKRWRMVAVAVAVSVSLGLSGAVDHGILSVSSADAFSIEHA